MTLELFHHYHNYCHDLLFYGDIDGDHVRVLSEDLLEFSKTYNKNQKFSGIKGSCNLINNASPNIKYGYVIKSKSKEKLEDYLDAVLHEDIIFKDGFYWTVEYCGDEEQDEPRPDEISYERTIRPDCIDMIISNWLFNVSLDQNYYEILSMDGKIFPVDGKGYLHSGGYHYAPMSEGAIQRIGHDIISNKMDELFCNFLEDDFLKPFEKLEDEFKDGCGVYNGFMIKKLPVEYDLSSDFGAIVCVVDSFLPTTNETYYASYRNIPDFRKFSNREEALLFSMSLDDNPKIFPHEELTTIMGHVKGIINRIIERQK